jgi:hypothetical protein
MISAFSHEIFSGPDDAQIRNSFVEIPPNGSGYGAYVYPHFPTVWCTLEQMALSYDGLNPHHANWCEAISSNFDMEGLTYSVVRELSFCRINRKTDQKTGKGS